MRARHIVPALIALLSAAGSAQVNLLPSTTWGFAPVLSGWHFQTPIPTAAGPVQNVAEAAVPIQVRIRVNSWSFDVTGAYAAAGIDASAKPAAAGTPKNGFALLTGPTDMKLRASGPIIGDRLILTAGANLPVGTTRLDGDETAVLQTAAAPALQMPIAAYGTGAGGTLGLITVIDAGGWAVALGGSLEQRTEYTPIALAIAGATTETRLTPGMSTHVTVGLDRVAGPARLSVLLLADAYGTDKIAVAGAGGATETGGTQYRLGPQITALARIDFGGGAWSEGALSFAVRHRAAFTDATGAAVTGSDGNYLDGSLGGVLGGGNRVGLVIGVDGRRQSGLPFTNALVGAAVTAGGATLGIETRHFRFVIHPQYGTFDTGVTHTTGFGGSIAMSFFAGRSDL